MSYRRSPILIMMALLIPAACTQPPPAVSGTSSPSSSPQPSGAAGTLVYYADVSDLISLDPAVAYEFSGVLLVHNVYETLVKFEGADLPPIQAEPRPELGHQGLGRELGHHVQAEVRRQIRERQRPDRGRRRVLAAT